LSCIAIPNWLTQTRGSSTPSPLPEGEDIDSLLLCPSEHGLSSFARSILAAYLLGLASEDLDIKRSRQKKTKKKNQTHTTSKRNEDILVTSTSRHKHASVLILRETRHKHASVLILRETSMLVY
jgi:hypothetical protein